MERIESTFYSFKFSKLDIQIVHLAVLIFTCNYVISLNCPPNTWACNNGIQCINATFRCNNVIDCSDGSDEGAICSNSLFLSNILFFNNLNQLI